MPIKSERNERPDVETAPNRRRPWHTPNFTTLDVNATEGGGNGGNHGGGGGGGNCYTSWKCS
jgi:hypothetical protein